MCMYMDIILFNHSHAHVQYLTHISLLSYQVLVIIDVKPKDLGLPTEAYISVEEIHDVSTLWIALNKNTRLYL